MSTQRSGRILMTFTFLCVLVSYNEIPIGQIVFLGIQPGNDAFRTATVMTIIFLYGSHLVNWAFDYISYRSWIKTEITPETSSYSNSVGWTSGPQNIQDVLEILSAHENDLPKIEKEKIERKMVKLQSHVLNMRLISWLYVTGWYLWTHTILTIITLYYFL